MTSFLISFKKTLMISGCAALLSVATLASAQAKTVATVNGIDITRAQVKEFFDASPLAARGMKMADVEDAIIDQLVTSELIDAEIEKSNFANDAAVKERIEEMRTQIARDMWMQQKLESKVSDDAVKAKYKETIKALSDEYEVKAAHILVETEEDAKAIIASLDKGEKFYALAKTKSIGPSGSNGGDLGYFTKAAMVPEFSKAAFDLKKGAYTKTPVKTQFGWHVIKVEDKRKLDAPKFEDLESRMRSELSRDAIGEVVEDLKKGAKIEIKK